MISAPGLVHVCFLLLCSIGGSPWFNLCLISMGWFVGLLLFCPGVTVVEILIPDSSERVLVFHQSDVLGGFALVAASSLVVSSRVSDTPGRAQVFFF